MTGYKKSAIMGSMSEEKKYQIVFSNKKTKEVKILSVEKLTFSEAASFSYNENKKLFERTGDTWEITSIYDVNFMFDFSTAIT